MGTTLLGKTEIKYRYRPMSQQDSITKTESSYFFPMRDFKDKKRAWKRRHKKASSWDEKIWEESYWRSRGVPVVYDPDRPSRSALGTKDKMWAPSGWMAYIAEGLIGIVALIGLLFGLSEKKKKGSTVKTSSRRSRR